MDLSLGDHPEVASPEDVNKFLTDKQLKFLVSFGDITKSKRNYLDIPIIDAFAKKTFKRSGTSTFLNGCGMVIDSGGYQIQKDKIIKDELIPFAERYYNYFLKEYRDHITESFILDVLPPHARYFSSPDEMKSYCHHMYYQAVSLPTDLRDKMIYVHHFGPNWQHDIYSNMLSDLHEYFNIYSCGGVSHLSNTMHVAPYALTMCEILHEKLKESNPKFRIHILGEGGFASILLFRLLEVHIKHIYNIDVEITYDSTTIQNTLLHGKTMYCINDNHTISQLDIRSHLLNSKMNGYTRRDYLYELYNKFLIKYNMHPLDPTIHPVYDGCEAHDIIGHVEYTGKFGRAIHLPAYLYGIEVYETIERWCDESVEELYAAYTTGDLTHSFVDRTTDVIKMFSTKQRWANAYAITFQNTLDAIRDLGEKPSETINKLKTEVHAICGALWSKNNPTDTL